MSGAFYNEIDPQAAAWLRELIAQGLIAPGVVDERDIQDISPADLRGFSQVHLFAGIGVWSYSLRRAGWPDDRPVWTASCPCQPFSSAGKGAGFDDERHLWPSVDWLAQQCQPECIFGEQVASKDAEPWLDLVQADLEGLGYAFGACAFPSAGVGAPHIRDRTYWVADAASAGLQRGWAGEAGNGRNTPRREPQRLRNAVVMADADGEHERSARDAARRRELGRRGEIVGVDLSGSTRLEGQRSGHQAEIGQREGSLRSASETSELGGLADASGEGHLSGSLAGIHRDEESAGTRHGQPERHGAAVGMAYAESAGQSHRRSRTAQSEPRGDDGAHRLSNEAAGPTNGLWGDADWLFCRDGKWRPVEPGTFPLAHGAPSRVGRLRGYGNAINAEAAAAFIRSYLEVRAVA